MTHEAQRALEGGRLPWGGGFTTWAGVPDRTYGRHADTERLQQLERDGEGIGVHRWDTQNRRSMAVAALEREARVHEVRSQLTIKNDLVHRHALPTD